MTILPGDARRPKSACSTGTRRRRRSWVTAFLYGGGHLPYDEVWRKVQDLGPDARQEAINECLAGLGPHDPPPRELELVDYTFEYMMDYGAYREFKRHRMQSYLPQLLSVAMGTRRPPWWLMRDGWRVRRGDIKSRGSLLESPRSLSGGRPIPGDPRPQPRVLSRLNLRECYHLFKLRTSEMAHFSIREPVLEAMRWRGSPSTVLQAFETQGLPCMVAKFRRELG